jgi:UDP-N-acetylmuramoyl-tripeptide--D-alanyl-D-alanine ligase
MLTFFNIIEALKPISHTVTDFGQVITGFSIDTRTLKPGNIFVALQGEVSHGNAFVDQAVAKGAVAVMTDQALTANIPVIVVSDSLAALSKIAEHQRGQFKGKVCGVTGTVGKTSVKEALGFLIQALGLKAHISDKSHNNHIGVPLTLANLNSTADIAVVEIGMNTPGEIYPLAKLTHPNVAIVTSIGPGHIGTFQGVEDIAKEKISIAAGLLEGGIAILPRDSEFFELMQETVIHQYKREVVSFGRSTKADVQLLSHEMIRINAMRITARVFDVEISYELPSSNHGWISNSLAVLASLHVMGVDVTKAATYFKDLSTVQGRGRVYSIKFNDKQITLIDDAYNANPVSMTAALENLSSYTGRKIAVIGDMRELGVFSKQYHRELGQLCEKLPIDGVLACGPDMRYAFDCLSSSKQLAHVGEYTGVLDVLSDRLQGGDVVLFKASNGTKLYQVVANILKSSEMLN